MKGTFTVRVERTNKFGETTVKATEVAFSPKKDGDNVTPIVTEAIKSLGLTASPLNESASIQLTITRNPQSRDFVVTGGSAPVGGITVKASSARHARDQVSGSTHAEVA